MTNDISGMWSFRSLLNNPNPAVPFGNLAVGLGTLEFNVCDLELTGTLGGEVWELGLIGMVTTGTLPKRRGWGVSTPGVMHWFMKTSSKSLLIVLSASIKSTQASVWSFAQKHVPAVKQQLVSQRLIPPPSHTRDLFLTFILGR